MAQANSWLSINITVVHRHKRNAKFNTLDSRVAKLHRYVTMQRLRPVPGGSFIRTSLGFMSNLGPDAIVSGLEYVWVLRDFQI